MYQHPYVTSAMAEQRRADLMAAAERARLVRQAKPSRSRVRLRRARQFTGSPVVPASGPAVAT